MSISGKALLVITRLHEHGENAHFEVSAMIQKCAGSWERRDCAQEEFQHLEYDVLPLPPPAYRLEPGETIRVHVVFCFSYSRWEDDYSGGIEHDVDLSYDKFRVLRRQKPRVRYISKSLRKGL